MHLAVLNARVHREQSARTEIFTVKPDSFLGKGTRELRLREKHKNGLSTHLSNFVFDMMSSFQFTKIRPISPSVRQPESAIGFWKTCSQKTRKVSNSPEAKAAQPLVYPGRDFPQCPISHQNLKAIPY